MAGVMNATLHQFNLKVVASGNHCITIMLWPGYNSVDDKYWNLLIDKSNPDPYVAELISSGELLVGAEYDDREINDDGHHVAEIKDQIFPTGEKEEVRCDVGEKVERAKIELMRDREYVKGLEDEVARLKDELAHVNARNEHNNKELEKELYRLRLAAKKSASDTQTVRTKR